MSEIIGASQLGEKFTRFARLVNTGIEGVLESEIKATQAEAVALCPVHTGQSRDILASDDAIVSRKSRETGGTQWTFRVPSAAFKLFWVEFGTKAYEAGSTRKYKDKKGRAQSRKVKKSRPAHRAYPFFRPAVANLLVRMGRARKLTAVVEDARKLAGFVETATAKVAE